MADSTFTLVGAYRVQSWRQSAPSHLVGHWIARDDDDPTEETVNAQLALHPLWRGSARVSLRPADIGERSGAFCEPDILYKQSNFEPVSDSARMATNIIDVRKAAANWRRRLPLMIGLVGAEAFQEVASLVGNVERTVADEYYFHEAGHCLGYPTCQKYNDGYFRLGGAARWSLIYTEEFRADLLAFGLAAAAIPSRRAAGLFLYNLMLRVGAEIEARDGPRPYGPIPTLLIGMLIDCGWLSVLPSGSWRFASLRPEDVVAMMNALGEHAVEHLVAPEDGMQNPLDAALVAARWLRSQASYQAGAMAFRS